MKYMGLFACASFLFTACNNNNDTPPDTVTETPSVPMMSYSVTGSFPHDTSSYTEALSFYNGYVLESTGNYGRSRLLQYDLKTGKVNRQLKLDSNYFGEGAVIFRDTIYQLTYKEKTVFVYNKEFKKIKQLPLNTEGWGLTTDGNVLIATDGSSNLYFYEPGSFRLLRTQSVTENGSLVSNINEVEYVNGFIYANQWQTNYILKIDVNSGQVVSKMDLGQLDIRAKAKYPRSEALNGIAYDSTTKKLYVTGKWWPEIYELTGSW
jgi:glutaminyl-peptide cyclotransferase